VAARVAQLRPAELRAVAAGLHAIATRRPAWLEPGVEWGQVDPELIDIAAFLEAEASARA